MHNSERLFLQAALICGEKRRCDASHRVADGGGGGAAVRPVHLLKLPPRPSACGGAGADKKARSDPERNEDDLWGDAEERQPAA